jgi:DNA-binding NtrC family response regulator
MKTIKTRFKSSLIIDHEEFGNALLEKVFFENGLHLDIISPNNDYMPMIEHKKYDCVLLNSDLMSSLSYDIVDKLKSHYPGIAIIILLKNPSYEKVFNFVRLGVDDFIMKPPTWEDIERVFTHYYY